MGSLGVGLGWVSGGLATVVCPTRVALDCGSCPVSAAQTGVPTVPQLVTDLGWAESLGAAAPSHHLPSHPPAPAASSRAASVTEWPFCVFFRKRKKVPFAYC